MKAAWITYSLIFRYLLKMFGLVHPLAIELKFQVNCLVKCICFKYLVFKL